MSNHQDSPQQHHPLDELVTELLGVGAVLSQLISGMVRFEASGRSAPDAAPIPKLAHSLIRGVLDDRRLRNRHSKRDLRVAARIVAEATEAICEEVFIVDFDHEPTDAEMGTVEGGDDQALQPLPGMDSHESTDHVAAFTRQLLSAGEMVFGLLSKLGEILPSDAYPGEEPGEVVLDMAIGSVRTAFESTDQRAVEDATELISAAGDRVLEHLGLAVQLSRRIHGEAGDDSEASHG